MRIGNWRLGDGNWGFLTKGIGNRASSNQELGFTMLCRTICHPLRPAKRRGFLHVAFASSPSPNSTCPFPILGSQSLEFPAPNVHSHSLGLSVVVSQIRTLERLRIGSCEVRIGNWELGIASRESGIGDGECEKTGKQEVGIRSRGTYVCDGPLFSIFMIWLMWVFRWHRLIQYAFYLDQKEQRRKPSELMVDTVRTIETHRFFSRCLFCVCSGTNQAPLIHPITQSKSCLSRQQAYAASQSASQGSQETARQAPAIKGAGCPPDQQAANRLPTCKKLSKKGIRNGPQIESC